MFWIHRHFISVCVSLWAFSVCVYQASLWIIRGFGPVCGIGLSVELACLWIWLVCGFGQSVDLASLWIWPVCGLHQTKECRVVGLSNDTGSINPLLWMSEPLIQPLLWLTNFSNQPPWLNYT